jgi:hypothetical protein
VRFGKIDFNPAHNPAILDTATWDEHAAAEILIGLEPIVWDAIETDAPLGSPQITPYRGSAARHGGSMFTLVGLADGQQAFIEIGPDAGQSDLGAPFATIPLTAGRQARAYRTDATIIDRYCRIIRPDKGPQPLGAIPRIGAGSRMSAALFPGSYRAMDACGFAANTIQNSVRELELLENILAGRPPEAIYYPGFGTVDSGHTGSTFEGLWTYGVLAALQSEGNAGRSSYRYGADADHIKVMPGAGGMARAKHVIECARYYSFYTLDVSGVLDYAALWVESPATAEAYLATLPTASERRAVVAYHRQGRRVGGVDYRPDEAMLGRLVGKYWASLAAAEELTAFVRSLKGNRPFDLEFAIDERSPDVGTCESITYDTELAFVLLESQRRGLPFTHVAPNFGVEKGVDYRCPAGLTELETRVRSQYRMADEFGMLLDFHSGDDLSSTTRQVIGRATQGRNHFKIAPQPQIIFAETVHDLYPALFREWWTESFAYAQREAASGSAFAAGCIREYETSAHPTPSPVDPIFHNFGFGFVGRRDSQGQYLNRERLYGLPAAFHREYQDRIVVYLCELAQDLFSA